MQDVQIVTFLTAYTDEYGRTWILVFNEVLWFGTIMYHSLINPNQIPMTVMPISRYPFYENGQHRRFFSGASNDITTHC